MATQYELVRRWNTLADEMHDKAIKIRDDDNRHERYKGQISNLFDLSAVYRECAHDLSAMTY